MNRVTNERMDNRLRKIFRGRILHCLGNPETDPSAIEYLEDGLMIVDQGKILEVAHSEALTGTGLDINQATDYGNKLIVPGFIDTHVHAPQMDVIASYGTQLLDWLEKYTFPTEMKFAEQEYAERAMVDFVDQLLASGTTTAMVYSTSHEYATDALFQAAANKEMCMIAGKVMMDRNAPKALLDTADSGFSQSKRLIDKWHNCGRLAYAVTPRFAITSTPDQLASAGGLMQSVAGLYMQTHLSETQAEIDQVKALFPEIRNYLEVYDRYGLCTDRSFFGHGIHLDDSELERLASTGGNIAFCPSSNLFLGSGLFDWEKAKAFGVDVSLASDVGGGLSLCMLCILAEAYKVCQLHDMSLAPMQALYEITLGNARSLGLDDKIGNFRKGSYADFLVLDVAHRDKLSRRSDPNQSIEDEWFAHMMLGDERLISETWVGGNKYHSSQDTRNEDQILVGKVRSAL